MASALIGVRSVWSISKCRGLHRTLATSSRLRDARKRILLMDEITLAQPVLQELKQLYKIETPTLRSRQEFLEQCRGPWQGIDGIYRHFNRASAKIVGKYDRELVEALPSSLRFIVHNGAGYDVDVDACTAHNIQVANVPTAVDGATADTATFLLIGALRQFGRAQANLRAGKFNAGLPLSNDPHGKLLGVLGLGGIGRAFAQRARALGMKVQYHNRTRLSPELEQGAKYVSFEELLESSDVVSLNLPLNAKTKHIIGEAEFKKMKRTAILINTARGGVVDEAALVDALDQGEIAGCGLDVYEAEPTISEGLLKSDKAFLLPHVGTLSVETQRDMETVCLRNLDTGLRTGKLAFTVPEQRGKF